MSRLLLRPIPGRQLQESGPFWGNFQFPQSNLVLPATRCLAVEREADRRAPRKASSTEGLGGARMPCAAETGEGRLAEAQCRRAEEPEAAPALTQFHGFMRSCSPYARSMASSVQIR